MGRQGAYSLLGSPPVAGYGPLLGNGDDADQLCGTRAGLVGYHRYLSVDLHGIDRDRGSMRPVRFGEGLGQSVSQVALASSRGAADDESLSLLLELRPRAPSAWLAHWLACVEDVGARIFDLGRYVPAGFCVGGDVDCVAAPRLADGSCLAVFGVPYVDLLS